MLAPRVGRLERPGSARVRFIEFMVRALLASTWPSIALPPLRIVWCLCLVLAASYPGPRGDTTPCGAGWVQWRTARGRARSLAIDNRRNRPNPGPPLAVHARYIKKAENFSWYGAVAVACCMAFWLLASTTAESSRQGEEESIVIDQTFPGPIRIVRGSAGQTIAL